MTEIYLEDLVLFLGWCQHHQQLLHEDREVAWEGEVRKDREWAFLIHLSCKGGALEKIESKLGKNDISYSTIGGSSQACFSRRQR